MHARLGQNTKCLPKACLEIWQQKVCDLASNLHIASCGQKLSHSKTLFWISKGPLHVLFKVLTGSLKLQLFSAEQEFQLSPHLHWAFACANWEGGA